MGAGSGCSRRRWKCSSLGRVSISAAQQAREGGCLGEGPGREAAEGRGRGCRRGARSPLLARHDCGTWCRGGGPAAGGRPGLLSIGAETRAGSRSSRSLLLLCGGNRCTQTESSCEQGAGRGLKGEPRVQTSAAPGGREQDRPPRPAAACSSPRPRHFQASFLARGNVNQRWFASADRLESGSRHPSHGGPTTASLLL